MKKKIFVFALLCAGLGMVSVSAQVTTKTVYYGEKANDSYKNPCKGPCVKICAEVENKFIGGGGFDDQPCEPGPFSVGGNSVAVKTVVRDAEGNVIKECVNVYPGDVETVKEELRLEAIKNGGVTE